MGERNLRKSGLSAPLLHILPAGMQQQTAWRKRVSGSYAFSGGLPSHLSICALPCPTSTAVKPGDIVVGIDIVMTAEFAGHDDIVPNFQGFDLSPRKMTGAWPRPARKSSGSAFPAVPESNTRTPSSWNRRNNRSCGCRRRVEKLVVAAAAHQDNCTPPGLLKIFIRRVAGLQGDALGRHLLYQHTAGTPVPAIVHAGGQLDHALELVGLAEIIVGTIRERPPPSGRQCPDNSRCPGPDRR